MSRDGAGIVRLLVSVQDHMNRRAVVWQSEAPKIAGPWAGGGECTLVLQNDGNVVIYWQSGGLL